MTDVDISHLRRAIRIAMNARGRVEPNPMVGCVLVKDGRVIGEGIHEQYGCAHAEPTALASCKESPAGATAYVTLEPCCHTNKKTPPCCPKLIEAGIKRVVIGAVDPNPDVDGKGIAMLHSAGIEVEPASGDVAAEAKQLLAPFISITTHRRPYVTLKWAESADGKVAGAGGKREQISNDRSSALVHQLRARSDAILVGINTVLSDDPQLTARGVEWSRPLTRLVLDSNLRLPLTGKLAQSARETPVEVYFTRQGFINAGPERIKQLMSAGVELKSVDEDDKGRISIPRLFAGDRLEGITHLLVEPGPTLARSFFDAGASDRLWVIRSPNRIDADDAPSSARIPGRFVRTGELELDGDVLTEYLDTESDNFFSAVPSADFVLATPN